MSWSEIKEILRGGTWKDYVAVLVVLPILCAEAAIILGGIWVMR